MTQVFVDTSALIAIGNRHDAFHTEAVRINEILGQSHVIFVTSTAVLLEFGSAFSAGPLRKAAIKMIEAIRASKKWHVVLIDNDILTKSFKLFKKAQDKEWGLVDCTSIIVAIEMNIKEVFTSDHHFEQAGFTILMNISR